MPYSVGVYSEKFTSLYMEHLYCILRAFNLCHELFIILHIGNGHNKINSCIRYRCLYQLTNYNGNVKIIMVENAIYANDYLQMNIVNRFNTNCIDEVGIEISERSGINKLMLPEEFIEILLQQKLNEIKAITQSNKILFIDIDALVTLFYLSFHSAPDTERKNTF